MTSSIIDINTFSSTYVDWNTKFNPNRVDYFCEIQSKSEQWRDFWIRVIIFPLGIYRVIHGLVGKCFSRAAGLSIAQRAASFQYLHCAETPREDGYLYKRIRVQVDDLTIDGMMIVHPETVANRIWLLYANENHECYEGPSLNSDREFYTGSFVGVENNVTGKFTPSFLAQIRANAILFNYPGVGDSGNTLVYRDAMVKAHYAMRRFLEDPVRGLGAEKIICFGSSIGGGIQGEDLALYPIDEKMKYCFIKNKTFSEARNVFINPLLQFCTWLTGWNISPVESSRCLGHPEIIIQSIRRPKSSGFDDYTALPSEFSNLEDIVDDGLIPSWGTLAHTLLHNKNKRQKHFVGVYGNHGRKYGEKDIELLAKLVNSVFE